MISLPKPEDIPDLPKPVTPDIPRSILSSFTNLAMEYYKIEENYKPNGEYREEDVQRVTNQRHEENNNKKRRLEEKEEEKRSTKRQKFANQLAQ
jgi:hypothetical protein